LPSMVKDAKDRAVRVLQSYGSASTATSIATHNFLTTKTECI
jgi:hypothetical protein